jgi:hypothetical protein
MAKRNVATKKVAAPFSTNAILPYITAGVINMKNKEDRNAASFLWKSSYEEKYTRTEVVDENNADTMRIAKVV